MKKLLATILLLAQLSSAPALALANGNIGTSIDNGTETKKNTSYFTDALDRLIGVTVTNPLKGLPVDIKYGYSNAGNLILETGIDTIQYNYDGKGNVLPSGVQNVTCVAPLIRDPATNTCKSPTVIAPMKSLAYEPSKENGIITRSLAFIFGIQTAYAQVVPITCTAPQTLDIASNTCKAPILNQVITPAPTVPASGASTIQAVSAQAVTCVLPQVLNTTTNACYTPAPTVSATPSNTDIITQLLNKLQSGTYSIKLENGIYTVGDTPTAVSSNNNQSGTVQINKGRTSANILFKTPFLTLPQILITPQGKATTDFEVNNVTVTGFTLNVGSKDYLQKRSFTYLALPQTLLSESEADDNDPTISSTYAAQNDLLIKEGIITGKTNEFTNPQAILKYNNSYFIYDKKGRLTSVKTYNTDGTIKQDETRTYTGDDRLKTLENKDIKETYFYDNTGNKIQSVSLNKTSNVTETTTNYFDWYRSYADRDEVDIMVSGKRFATIQYYNQGTPQYTQYPSGENVIYYSNDPLGSSTLSYNELGVLQEQTDPLPYGDKRFAIDSKNVTSKFALHDRNENTNQAYMKARNYDFSNKHFQTQDVISKYNPQAYTISPQELNMYAYARNNPVMYNDPTGNCATGLVVDTVACVVVADAALTWLAAAGAAALVTGGAYWYSTTKNSADTQKGDAVSAVTAKASTSSSVSPSSSNDEKEKQREDKSKKGKDNYDRGADGENQMQKEFGFEKNQNKVPNPNRPGSRLQPDRLDDKVLGEVKNVKVQALTRQIRDYTDYKTLSGRAMELYTNINTRLTKPLVEFAKKNSIQVFKKIK